MTFGHRGSAAALLLTACALSCAPAPAGTAAAAPGAQAPALQRLRLVPQDEAARVPGFAATAQRLRDAVRARDAQAVVALLGDDVRIGFDESERGPDAFRRRWRLGDRNSEFWTIAETLLEGGSAVDGACGDPAGACLVSYPFWSARFPDDQLDRPFYLIARGDSVPMYDEPAAAARVIETPSYEVVREAYDPRLDAPGGDMWQAVALLDGRRGFLRARDVASPTADSRMMFTRQPDGRWVLSSVVAGD